MRVLIVFESMFGNTQRIADAIADGLAGHADVRVIEVGEAPTRLTEDVDLLVVGGPTHVHGMSRPRTRDGARQQAEGPLVSPGVGMREWLATLGTARPGISTVTFDTRIGKARWLTGSAARSAAKFLRRQGFPVLATASFVVLGTAGPLAAGESERARQWGVKLRSVLGVPHRR